MLEFVEQPAEDPSRRIWRAVQGDGAPAAARVRFRIKNRRLPDSSKTSSSSPTRQMPLPWGPLPGRHACSVPAASRAGASSGFVRLLGKKGPAGVRCKPSSVPPRGQGEAARRRRPSIWTRPFGRALPTLIGKRPTRGFLGLNRATEPLLGLAPGGVCRAGSLTRPAVRSYRTISPLPWLAKASQGKPCRPRRLKAVYFLWHFPGPGVSGLWPVTSGRWVLPTTVVQRCSDFPPPPSPRRRRERPSTHPATIIILQIGR